MIRRRPGLAALVNGPGFGSLPLAANCAQPHRLHRACGRFVPSTNLGLCEHGHANFWPEGREAATGRNFRQGLSLVIPQYGDDAREGLGLPAI